MPRAKRRPVEEVGFLPPRPPRHDPEAMVEPESGTRVPPGFRKVVSAVEVVPPTTVDPRTTPLRATQTTVSEAHLQRHAQPGKRGRGQGLGAEMPVIYKAGREHYVVDGHHRVANALLQGQQFTAKVVSANSARHRELAEQVRAGEEMRREPYRRVLDETRAAGLRYPINREDPEQAALLARQHEAFYASFPERAKNRKRRELGLPPKRRR